MFGIMLKALGIVCLLFLSVTGIVWAVSTITKELLPVGILLVCIALFSVAVDSIRNSKKQ